MMRRILTTFGTALAGLLLVLAVACGGSGGDEATSNAPVENNGPAGDGSATNGHEPEAAVLSAVEALGRSAEDFQDEVESLRGEMAMDMSMGDMSFGLNGDFAFKAPDQMHMQMEFTGGDGQLIDMSQFGSFEILMRDDRLYMYMPFFGGWVVATLDELGVDAQQYQEMVNNHSPFDYADLVESFGDGARVNDLGEEEMNGKSYRHYRIESDIASLLDALSGAFGEELSGDGALPVDGVSGTIVADVWLDSETLLPYKLTAEGSFTGEATSSEPALGEMTFTLTIIVAEYNGYVTLPEPPADAKPFAELGAEMFAEE
jgi:outer membrane lipoprotein-sorting protein